MGLFSITPIIREHFSSLVRDSSRRRTIVIFGIFPGLVGLLLSLGGVLLNKSFTQVVISILAILVGFSINALVLLMRNDREVEEGSKEEELMENTRNHTMYALILGLTILSYTAAIYLLQVSSITMNDGPSIAGSALFYAGLIHYVQTLYLLPARLYAIADEIF